MNLRNSCAVAAGTLFLATAGVTFVATPAVAAPASGTVVAGTSAPGSDRDFRQGYRAGRDDGWEQARDECSEDGGPSYLLRNSNRDWVRGYELGWDAGYAKGFREFCGYHDDYKSGGGY
ncbi:MAG TPA: hypothetical protein VN408_03790 [Actinoplanes sp.]|nr:hypothetical protein [Actinoplanes sp.]